MRDVISNTWFQFAAGVALAATISVAMNWPSIALTSAIASSEQRPALLNDASWNDPAYAKRLQDRFGNRLSDAELLSWLEQNGFEIDRETRIARKRIHRLPCNEDIEVTWTVSATGSMAELKAVISEAGCI